MPPVRLPPVIALLGLLLAGCSARPEPAASTTSLEAYAGVPGTSMPVSTAQREPTRHRAAPLVRLPVILARSRQVDEWRDLDRKSQVIALEGGAGTRGEIRLDSGHRSSLAKPTEGMIRSEIAAAFPGQSARIVTTPRHNSFGPYGLAVVAGPGEVRCVYAWQWLSGTDSRTRHGLGGRDAVWRLQLCRDDMALDTMAAALDRLELGEGRSDAVPRVVRRGPDRVRQEASPRRLVTEQQVPVMSGHYLAPVAAPTSATPTGAAYARFDQTLPAEAYRGPAYRQSASPRAVAGRPAIPAP